MRNSICVSCGRVAIAEGLCDEHYTKKHDLFEAESLVIQACDKCGSVYDNRWKRATIEDALRDIIRQSIKVSCKLEDIIIGLKHVGNNYAATITVLGTIPPATIVKSETRKIDIRIKNIKCPNCVKLLGNYHESVIQIRGKRASKLISLFESVTTAVPKRVDHIKEGWNIYFIRKSDARTAINDVKVILNRARETELEVIRSHKVVGQKQGKNLMRDFYAIR